MSFSNLNIFDCSQWNNYYELTGGYDIIKGERVKIQGYLEDFALSKEEADELIMSARNIVYKD